MHVSLLLCGQAVWAAAGEGAQLVRTNRAEMSDSSTGAKLLADVEKMARTGSTPEPGKLQVIQNIVNDNLLPDLKKEKTSAETQIGKNLAAINTCNTNAGNTLQNIKTTTEVTVGQKRTDHASCREEEKGKNSTKGSKCYELDTFLDGINVPADLPAGRPRAQMVQYVETMSTYFCPKGPEVTKLDEACTTASNEHAAHKAECDKKQATFELGFCTWKTQLEDACYAQTTCYDGAVKTHNEFVSDTKELVKKWKVEYASLQKILCYVDVWLNDKNVNTADADQYAKCNGSYVDTSPMDVTYPDVPAKAVCDMTAVQNYPGTPGFVTAEYSNFLDHASDPIPCLAPASF